MAHRYKKAALGGTFDRLHKGHVELLKTAAQVSDALVVGLTTEDMYKAKTLSSIILPYAVREQELQETLRRSISLSKVTLVPLTDVYGTTLTDPTIDGLVVTPQTSEGAKIINKERHKRGMGKLPITQVPLVTDDDGEHLSSTRIRAGVVNRQGRVYRQLFKTDLVLTAAQKEILRELQGNVVTHLNTELLLGAPCVITVGDVTTQHFLSAHYPVHVAIVDGKAERQTFLETIPFNLFERKGSAVNPPGMISQKAAFQVFEACGLHNKTTVITVAGEEDLLGLPALLSAPLESLLFYGQRGVGMVMIRITEQKKEALVRILEMGVKLT